MPKNTVYPDKMTNACKELCIQEQRILKLVEVSLAKYLKDEACEVDKKYGLGEKLEEELSIIISNKELVIETMYCKGVNNFDRYLEEIVLSVCNVKPEILGGKELKVYLKDFFRGGIKCVSNNFKTKLNLSLLNVSADIDEVERMYAIRDLSTHKNNIIDNRFYAILGNRYGKLGERIKYKHDQEISKDMLFLQSTVIQLDKQVVSIYGLSEVPFDEEADIFREYRRYHYY